ncbi:hypothetical protein QYF36_010975 [Acer negundo]|nr:hypothetical protein QYF36_010975 [Acer negundo]
MWTAAKALVDIERLKHAYDVEQLRSGRRATERNALKEENSQLEIENKALYGMDQIRSPSIPADPKRALKSGHEAVLLERELPNPHVPLKDLVKEVEAPTESGISRIDDAPTDPEVARTKKVDANATEGANKKASVKAGGKKATDQLA